MHLVLFDLSYSCLLSRNVLHRTFANNQPKQNAH